MSFLGVDWADWDHLAQVLMMFITGGALIFAWRAVTHARKQTEHTRKQNELAQGQIESAAALELFKFLQEDRHRKARGQLWNIWRHEEPFNDEVAGLACSSLDIMGLMLKNGLAPVTLFLPAYAQSAQMTFLVCDGFIRQRKESHGQHYWHGLDWIKIWFKEHPNLVPQVLERPLPKTPASPT